MTIFSYDSSYTYLTSVEYFDGSTINYIYETGSPATCTHALMEIVFPGDRHQYYTYDDRGRLASAFKAYGAEMVTYSYDNVGMIVVTDAIGNKIKYYLDHRGQIIKTENRFGDTTRSVYDDYYNLIRVEDAGGFVYQYKYNDRGNLIQSIDPLGNITKFKFSGPFDRMASFIDANDNKTEFQYDEAGNLTSIIYVNNESEEWHDFVKGLPSSWTNCRGNSITYEYDANGRLTTKIYEDTSRVDYHYNTRGLLDYMMDVTGTTTYDYETEDHLKKITDPDGRYLEYTYNDAGQRTSILDQLGNRLDYHYDDVGRLASITDESLTEIVHYFYDIAGRLEKMILTNGIYTTYEYDEAWRLTSLINYNADESVLSSFSYAYDQQGRQTCMTTLQGEWIYEYDDLGQLTSWTSPDGRYVEYEYDAVGNRISVVDDGIPIIYTTNNMNQYTQVGNTTYDYDEDGNMDQKIEDGGITTTTYTYNDENQMISVMAPSYSCVNTYDGSGNRVRMDYNGILKDFVIDPFGFGNLVGEYEGSTGALLASYNHGFGLLTFEDSGEDVFFYTFNGMGSTSEITNNAGTILNAYNYSPFGKILSMTEDKDNTFEYIGQYGAMEITNGLYHIRAREFMPAIGRFISKDPMDKFGLSPNLYTYCYNSPNSLIDIDGLAPYDTSMTRTIINDFYKKGRGNWSWAFGDAYEARQTDPSLALRDAEHYLFARDLMHEASKHWGVKGQRTAGVILKVATAAYSFLKLSPVNRVLFGWFAGSLKPATPPSWDEIWYGWIGVDEHFEDYYPADVVDNVQIPSVLSRDPNEKSGPAGIGPHRVITENIPLAYRIDFENDETATAPAQIVTIEDPLNQNFNWNTFELKTIGFGDVRITVPEKSQHFETIVPMNFNDVDFEVQIEVGINLDTGVIDANFYSIDPETNLPPSVDVGFLPPEDGTGRGKGFFTYIVRLRQELFQESYSGRMIDTPFFMRIPNIAYISFDFQEAIATNQIDPHDPGAGTDPEKEAYISLWRSAFPEGLGISK